MDLVHDLHGQTHFGQHHGGAGGGVDLKAHPGKLLGDLTDLRLIADLGR